MTNGSCSDHDGYVICLECGGIYIREVSGVVRFMNPQERAELLEMSFAPTMKQVHDEIIARMIG